MRQSILRDKHRKSHANALCNGFRAQHHLIFIWSDWQQDDYGRNLSARFREMLDVRTRRSIECFKPREKLGACNKSPQTVAKLPPRTAVLLEEQTPDKPSRFSAGKKNGMDEVARVTVRIDQQSFTYRKES